MKKYAVLYTIAFLSSSFSGDFNNPNEEIDDDLRQALELSAQESEQRFQNDENIIVELSRLENQEKEDAEFQQAQQHSQINFPFDLVKRRRHLTQELKEIFKALSVEEQRQSLFELKGQFLNILQSNAFHDDESSVLAERNVLDNFFFEALDQTKSYNQAVEIFQNHLNSRLDLHLTAAKTIEEEAAIRSEELCESEDIRLDIENDLNRIREEENQFRDYLADALNHYLQQALQQRQPLLLSEEVFLRTINLQGFSTDLIHSYFQDMNLMDYFAQTAREIVVQQEKDLQDLLEISLQKNQALTLENFQEIANQGKVNAYPVEMIEKIWNDCHDDLVEALELSNQLHQQAAIDAQRRMREARLNRFANNNNNNQ